ncbi:contractile injection system protein, VgrG/Pvc8 family [Acinetobacter johnsonii]|uniref:contractile injection system protein, VgrG/Pvc8 family n=1 Tax=Acinetobacter johnsonii TaxID=40214 RepID=UPI002448AB98|nr:contractile injection system protein, VgrG/Pvc8 family [Acinetobacter johnsonii]MDH0834045.1 contractile injection system protein, VgrG/Pvc8 family [Acinetobacter johnsonii]MDH0837286.1 contractile injection system protein, VgrG/Pvc8 family [Acinetobacter johnsonii]
MNLMNELDDSYPHAIFRLLVDGVDIGTKFQDRLNSLTITDNRGMESDALEVTLSDHDGLLNLPPKDAVIQAWIGWSNTGLVYKGLYKVKEVEHSGAPDILTIRASSADLKSGLKQKKERSFSNVTLEAVLQAIAFQHELDLSVHQSLAKRQIINLIQNESDANLLTRLADEHDAMASIKNGKLLFMPKGASQTISGQDLPTYLITRDKGDSHRYSNTDGGDEITAVRAFYYDAAQGKKLEVVYGDASNQNIKELRHIHQDKQSATLVAKAKLADLKRTSLTFSYNLAYGNPDLIPEMTFLFDGLKEQIDEIYWLGTRITHSIDASNGFTTALELEVFCPDVDDVSELFEDQFELEKDKKWTGVVVYYQSGNKAVALTKGDQSNPKHFTYLYVSREAAQARLDREYALLDPETGKFSAHNELEIKPYTGLKAQYTIGKKIAPRYWVTLGDQSNPKVINKVYQSKKAAERRLKNEMPRLNAKKDMLQQVKETA